MTELAASVSEPQIVNGQIKISVRGKWIKAPARRVNGQTIVVKGSRIRISCLHDEDWLESEILNPEACVQSLKDHRSELQADLFRFSQKVPDTIPRYNYPLEMRSIAVASVPSFSHWWDALPQGTRKNIRRAQKRGVELKVLPFDDEVIRGIAAVQNESPIRQGRLYCHYGKSLDQVKRDHGAFLNRSDFICAYFEGEFIGFLKLVYCGTAASILQLNAKMAHRDKRTSNALVAKAVELCAAKDMSYLIYGQFNYGNKRDSPLREFKVRHGFEEMLIPGYVVPLTLWGHFCVRTRLYRGLIGVLPSRAIKIALNLRAKWYQLRDRLKRNSSASNNFEDAPATGSINPTARITS